MSTISYGWALFFFLHKTERQSILQHSILLVPKPQVAPLKICNSTEFMQDTAASPTARHHLGPWNALILEDLEACWEYQRLGDYCPRCSYQKASRNPQIFQVRHRKPKRQNDQKSFLHVYNWIMTIFCSPALPPEAWCSLGQWEQGHNAWWWDQPYRSGHALACSSCSRESVLLSNIRIILCRLIPSIKIKNVYSEMRFQDHSVLIDREMTMNLQCHTVHPPKA